MFRIRIAPNWSRILPSSFSAHPFQPAARRQHDQSFVGGDHERRSLCQRLEGGLGDNPTTAVGV